MTTLKGLVDALVYASVLLGLLFLAAANGLVPSWLFAALVAGEVAYALAAAAVALGKGFAYYAVEALAVLVLVVSLPQPEHYAFASNGNLGRFLIFAIGSALQFAIIILIPVNWSRSRALRRASTGPSGDDR